MKKYRVLLIIIGIIFFISALTIYLNRVVFPVQIKKMVTAQAETLLKRSVEIEGIHFNWVKGFIIDKIKIYQKDSSQVLLQAERVSFGLIIIPGFKQQRITIPFIHIENPSIQLIHTGNNAWNFSDILASLTTPPKTDDKPLPFTVTVAGVDIAGGKVRIDDTANNRNWSELLDEINLKVNLSYQGIHFELQTNLPRENGLLAAQGSYMPLTQAIDGHLQLKNIKPSDYLSMFPPIASLELKNGLIEDIDLDINYNKELIKAAGDISIKNLDLNFADQSFSGTIEARHSQIIYKNGPIEATGDFKITQANATINNINAQGNVTASIHEAVINPDQMSIDGNIDLSQIILSLSPKQILKGNITLKNLKARRDKDGTQIVGKINAQGLDITQDTQSLKGDFLSQGLIINISPKSEISTTGDLQLNNLDVKLSPTQLFTGSVILNSFKLNLTTPKDITLSSKVSINQMHCIPMANTTINGSVELSTLNLQLKDDELIVKTDGELNNWDIHLDQDKNAVIEANFNLEANYPLTDPAQLTYSGSFELHDAEINGFPYGPFKSINTKADFKTDNLNVRSFSVSVMDTAIKGALTLINFKNPVLNLDASSDRIDLSKLKIILPDLVKQYGLETTGVARFNAQFEGLISDPLGGSIKAHADLENINVSSATFKQAATNISGGIDATPNSLTWHNFTGTYLGKTYTLTGNLNDFKNPSIKTSLDGDDVKLTADVIKKDNIITINTLTGKYLKIAFDATGTVDLSSKTSPLLNIKTKETFTIDDILGLLTEEQKKPLVALKPSATISLDATIKGEAAKWQEWTTDAIITSPLLSIMGYKINNLNMAITQKEGKISNLTIDATAYEGKIHTVASGDVSSKLMPFDIALNIDGLDLQKLKMDIPNLSAEEIKGKFYLTTVGKANLNDYKSLSAKGSMAIREGFLTEFKMFKGLLSVLNEALRIGQVMITDVEGNFVIENQKITTDNLRLKSPTIVLLTTGWVNFDQICDLYVGVDMTSGIVPSVAEEVLRSLQIHIFDKISNPKFTKKISVPQVINSVIKALGILQ